MSAGPGAGYGTPPPVLPPNPGTPVVRRAPGGIRLPVLGSLAVVLLVAALIVALGGRGAPPEVPVGVLEARASVTSAAAVGLRRGLDEAATDLAVQARVLAGRDPQQWEELLEGFLAVHDRYRVVYVVGEDRGVRVVAGRGTPRPELLPEPLPRAVGLTEPVEGGAAPQLLAFAPLRLADEDLLLVGRYDVSFLRFGLELTAPGEAYVVSRDRRVVGSTVGFLALQDLPGEALRTAAAEALAGDRVVARTLGDVVTTASPIEAETPAGRLGLAVVTGIERQDLRLPQYEARRLALLVGTLLALLGVLAAFWTWLAVVAPVRRLVADAERVATGDRRQPVHVRRYDEVGLVARALERCRVLLTDRASRG